MLHLICVCFFLMKTTKPQMLKESYELVKSTTSAKFQPTVSYFPAHTAHSYSEGAPGDPVPLEEGNGS